MIDAMYFRVFLGLICAALIALTVTPIVRVLAYKIGAVDVPKDNRRMHKKPMPLLGGLSIFLGFTISGLLFCDVTPSLVAAWFGGLLIITIGILDDKYALNAWIKLLGQIAAAAVAVGLGGVQIDHINLFGKYLHFGVFAIPITILWIVGMTNAINMKDELGTKATSRFTHRAGIALIEQFRKPINKMLAASTRFEPYPDIYKLGAKAEEVFSLCNTMGEGWLLTAEMMEIIESGYGNIVCAQPFGCLPNHIVGKGMIRKLKELYPDSNIVPIDYDPGATRVNQENRIKLMLAVAQENLNK
jgi:hypothetical protein